MIEELTSLSAHFSGVYNPYDPFWATSLAHVQASGLMSAAAAAGLSDPRLQNLAAAAVNSANPAMAMAAALRSNAAGFGSGGLAPAGGFSLQAAMAAGQAGTTHAYSGLPAA